jgi:hypothetical protein
MSRRLSLSLAVLALLAFAVAPAAGVSAASQTFRAHLTGDQEVPPRETLAQGQANFFLSNDGTELRFRLNVANIENVVAAHIHLAPPGVNGGVVAFLFGSVAPGGGRFDGVLAEGTITANDLINALAGHPLADLIEELEAGNAYVNVHTNDGVAPIDTGAGDFPGGEIRGQIS